MKLQEILELVGKLDDSGGEDSPRERFRRFLRKSATSVGQLRDYVEECLRQTDTQYSRALQDLVNRVGELLGFEIQFGRYKGTSTEIGFDGYWRSHSGFHIVVEVKTSETYPIKTSQLVRYVDELISDRQIPNWERALGLYVIGKPDPGTKQLEHSIIAERRTERLRTISVDSLLTLAELMEQADITHDDVLSIIRPSGPNIDHLVNLIARLRASVGASDTVATVSSEESEPLPSSGKELPPAYWLCPVASEADAPAEEVVHKLVGEEKIWAFGNRTPGRQEIKPGDWICFYASGKGVVAHAQVASYPEKKPHAAVRHSDQYSWTFRLRNPVLYLDNPVVIDPELRVKLDSFAGRDPNKAWAWFVQATRKLPSEKDFLLLTRQKRA